MRHPAVVQRDATFGHQAFGVATAGHARAREPLGDAFAPRPGRIAHARQAAISASKMRRSPGSMKNSGCHCTPRQKR